MVEGKETKSIRERLEELFAVLDDAGKLDENQSKVMLAAVELLEVYDSF